MHHTEEKAAPFPPQGVIEIVHEHLDAIEVVLQLQGVARSQGDEVPHHLCIIDLLVLALDPLSKKVPVKN